MKKEFLRFGGLLALALAVHGPEAGAFTLLTQSEARWTTDEVAVDYNTSGCPAGVEFPGDLEAAFDLTWNAVAFSRLRLSLGSATTATAAQTGRILITCSALASSAGGTTGVSSAGDAIASAIIQINSATNWSALSKTTLRLVIAHELGHAIGFGHSDDNHALMFFTIRGEALSQDDLDAVAYLYPRNDFSDGAFGCGSLENPGDGAGGAFAGMAGMLLLAQLAALVSARRPLLRRKYFRS